MIELSIIVKATLTAALGLIAAAIARRARASIRHAIVASTFGMLLILPAAIVWLPALTIPVPMSVTSSLTTPLPVTPPSAVPAAVERGAVVPSPSGGFDISIRAILIVIWAIGFAALAITLAIGVWRLRQLRRTGLPWMGSTGEIAKWRNGEMAKTLMSAGVGEPIEVLLHEEVAAPLVYGLRRPVLIMPRESTTWSAPELRRAMIHELEHVRRYDWWVQLAARVACAMYWFHPLVWIAYRQLALDAERACDDAVIAREEGTQYAEQLVALARQMGMRAQPALSMANRSDLSARVSAVLDPRRPRGRAGVLRAAIVVSGAATVLLTIAPLRLAAAVTSLSSEEQRRPRVQRVDRALVEAADEGDVDGVKELLDGGANINAMVDGDGSPLIVAARGGYLELVTMLLDRGADPNLAVSGDGNPLIMAARDGHTKIVELLLDRGARVDDVVPGDENALISASGEGQLEVVKLLVARGADVNAQAFAERAYERPNGEWRTPLSMARREGHRAVVEYLISVGATR